MCNNSTPGPTSLTTGGQRGYAVTAGYDMVTGVGSPDLLNFITNFGNARPTPTVTVAPSATTITALQGLTMTITVTPPSGQPVPTGEIKLSASDYVRSEDYAGSETPLTNGTAIISIPAGSLSASIDVVTFTAEYLPDSPSHDTDTRPPAHAKSTLPSFNPP